MDLKRDANGAVAPLTAHAPGHAHAVGGVAPVRVWAPRARDEAADAVREAAREKLPLVPRGGGVSLTRGAAPAGPFAVLDLRALARIVRYEPDDYTLTAEAGITIGALRDAVTASGQELPLEAAIAGEATLGGVFAANASGPRRMRFGSPRDRILGARFVTGDGVLVRTGGGVVKNVAGHAVHRLLCGSRGALAAIVEVSMKLPPRTLARAAMVWGADAARLTHEATWAGFARREPAVLTVAGRALAESHAALRTDAPFTLIAGFEDEPSWVDAQVAQLRERVGEPVRVLRDADAAALWQVLADLEETAGPRLTCTTASLTPPALAPLPGTPHAERVLFHAAAGRLHAWPAADAAALAQVLAGAGFATIEARGADVPGAEPVPALRALRGRIRAALDPAGVFAFGERWAQGA